MPRPIDIVADSLGRWRAMYEDGSLGPPLTLDEMLDLLPHLAPAPDGDDELVGKAAGALFRPGPT